jgi:hypothetical protein
MPKIVWVIAALGFLAATAPAFAQKKSCDDVCLKRCETAASKSWCLQKCVQACNMKK